MAKQLPHLSHAELEDEWRRLGLGDAEQAGEAGEGAQSPAEMESEAQSGTN